MLLKLIIGLSLGLLLLAVAFVAIIFFVFKNISDLSVAQSLPRYPNAENWLINSSSGFPDGLPSAEITFNTSDFGQKVIDFYSKELVRSGWQIDSTYVEKDESNWSGFKNYSVVARKNISGTDFNVHVVKSEPIRRTEMTKKYTNNRVIIFVSHHPI